MTLLGRARSVSVFVLAASGALLAGAARPLPGACGPFTDVAADAFCPFVLEIFALGITTGTTPTTYDPAGNVTRLQMAAFLSRTVDGVVRRGSRRAALNQFWTVTHDHLFGSACISPGLAVADGQDVWVPCGGSGRIERRQASTDVFLATWTGATAASSALSAWGLIVVTGSTSPGQLYAVLPSIPPGAVFTVASNLGDLPQGIAFDGQSLWTANTGGSVSIVTPQINPFQFTGWPVATVTTGFTAPLGALFDGKNVWVTDNGADRLFKLNGTGAILQTVTVGSQPRTAVFDGANIWVPNAGSSSVSIVRATTGAVIATLTGNGLNGPYAASFNGELIAVANPIGDSVSIFNAAALTPLGSVSTGSATFPVAVCSDGIHFWLSLQGGGGLFTFF